MRKLIFLFLTAVFILPITGHAQLLKKLGKRAERAAERTVERRVDRETTEKTDQVLDSILEPGSKDKKNRKRDKQTGSSTDPNPSVGNPTSTNDGATSNRGDSELQVYSKFDFVPGEEVLFYDDFAQDFVGDFPAKWNTNGSGEVVSAADQKWLELKSGYGVVYLPDVPDLPEDFTVEFDILTQGIDQQTSSTAVLKVGVSDDTSFKWGKFANVDIPFCQYAPVGFFVRNGGDINNKIDGDIRNNVLNQPHISIAVNRQRFRLWVDESKYLDIPRMIPTGVNPQTIKFEMHQFKDGKERLFISNLKVAAGGSDLRRELINRGRVSTNGILFDTGSANIQPKSMGIIRQVSQVLQQESGMRLKIVGHTDSDGNEAANRDLSQRRAEAVKKALVSVYGIDGSRLQTEGKGEVEPVEDNATAEGRAKNRRVEFVKI